MAGSFGWAGDILYVNLSDGSIRTEPTSNHEPEKYLGGVGLCTRIFWDMGCPRVEALSPENPLILASGPLTGVPGPFGRGHICSIAPQSYPQELFTYSSFGGRITTDLKWAGYDALVITGAADKPVYLSILDDRVEIRDAGEIWGLGTYETQEILMRTTPGKSMLCIGPAGENLCRNAAILSDSFNAAGQGGFGGVMGSKKLKAIAAKGTGNVGLAHPDEVLRMLAERKRAGEWMEGRKDLRSPMELGRARYELPKKYGKRPCGAFGCQYQCGTFYDVPGIGKGGAMCANFWYNYANRDNAAAIFKGSYLGNKLGINHYDTLGIVQVLSELHSLGRLNWEDWQPVFNGPAPEIWGGTASDQEFIDALLRQIATGKHPFSQGAARGLDQVLTSMQNEEELRTTYQKVFPAFGYTIHFLGFLGFALHWALDVRDPGGGVDEYHDFAYKTERSGTDPLGFAEHFGVPGGESTYAHPKGSEIEGRFEDIERQTLWVQQSQSVKNSLPMCAFQAMPYQYFHPPEMDYRLFLCLLYTAATGRPMDVDTLWQSGERIWNLRRAVMVRREGRRREQDTFHDVILDSVWDEVEWEEMIQNATDAIPQGQEVWKKTQIPRAEFEALKSRYYELCAWDAKTGRPTRRKLQELDMDDVARVLEAENLI